MSFTNDAAPIARQDGIVDGKRKYGYYGYDLVSPYLLTWARLFQRVISQAGTYLLTRKFHTEDCGIFKAEGGCNIAGVGWLQLNASRCSWDSYVGKLEERIDPLYRLAGLITNVVLGWYPEDPIESILRIAAINANAEVKLLREAIAVGYDGGPYSGNALNAFFDRMGKPYEVDAAYQYWCEGKGLA